MPAYRTVHLDHRVRQAARRRNMRPGIGDVVNARLRGRKGMYMTVARPACSLEQKVLDADNLPTLPGVALKVLELTQNPDVSAAAIAQVIQADPALAAKVLKMANSSIFGMSRKIASLRQAMVLLGLRAVKVMVLSFSLMESFDVNRAKGTFDFAKHWRRSLSMAVAAKLLAEATNDPRRDEAFVGGLLADIGILATFRGAREEYEPVLEAYANGDGTLHELELDSFGVTHAQIAAQLLASWSLPELLTDAVAAHHGAGFDALEGPTRSLAGLLWASALIADLFCGDSDLAKLDEIKQRCVELTDLEEPALEAVLDQLDGHVAETACVFSVEIGETTSYEQIRTQAMSQLAAISMDAELSRAEATRREQSTREKLEQLTDRAETLELQAHTDSLTGVGNRHAFEVGLQQAIDEARDSDGCVGLILLDLDHFKKLNDTYGHQAGDQALRNVGECLNNITDQQTLAARYGGEEFAVVLGGRPANDVRSLADQICKAVAGQTVSHRGQNIRLTASLGAAHVCFAHERAEPRELIERADECLYRAKHNGRNRVEVTF